MSYRNDTQDKQEISCEIKQHIGVMSESNQGWTKELNIVSWSGRPAKYDIRDWSKDHSRMSRGITLTSDETKQLKELLRDTDLAEIEKNFNGPQPAMAEDAEQPY